MFQHTSQPVVISDGHAESIGYYWGVGFEIQVQANFTSPWLNMANNLERFESGKHKNLSQIPLSFSFYRLIWTLDEFKWKIESSIFFYRMVGLSREPALSTLIWYRIFGIYSWNNKRAKNALHPGLGLEVLTNPVPRSLVDEAEGERFRQ